MALFKQGKHITKEK